MEKNVLEKVTDVLNYAGCTKLRKTSKLRVAMQVGIRTSWPDSQTFVIQVGQ